MLEHFGVISNKLYDLNSLSLTIHFQQ